MPGPRRLGTQLCLIESLPERADAVVYGLTVLHDACRDSRTLRLGRFCRPGLCCLSLGLSLSLSLVLCGLPAFLSAGLCLTGTSYAGVDLVNYEFENQAAARIDVFADLCAVVDVGKELRVDDALIFGLES